MAEQGSSSKSIEPAKKKSKKYHQKFLPSYTKDFPCIIASKISTEHARCVPCELDFKISHGGLDDVSRHCSSARHIEKSAALKNASNIHFHFENKTILVKHCVFLSMWKTILLTNFGFYWQIYKILLRNRIGGWHLCIFVSTFFTVRIHFILF